MAFQLTGDGIVDNLYHLLWTKDTMFHKKAKIPIPHTIIYKFEQPAHWYFTSKQGELMKRRGQNLGAKEIEQVFLKKISKSGIVAYYIYNKKEKNIISILNKQDQRERANQKAGVGDDGRSKKNKKELVDEIHEFIENQQDEKDRVFQDMKEKKGDNSPQTVFELLDQEGFLLQKFVDPQGDYNSKNFLKLYPNLLDQIRVIWSPKIVLFEKKVNKCYLWNTKLDIYQRGITFEEKLQGTQITEQSQKLTEKIAKHLSNVTFDKCRISRLVLHFKTDKKDNIKFLWCSSLRVENDKEFPPPNEKMNNQPLRLDSCLQITDQVYQVNSIDQKRPFQLLKNSLCYCCFKPVESDKLYPISYSVIIQDHEKRNSRKDIITVYNEDCEVNFKGMEHQKYLTVQGPHVIPAEKSGQIKFDGPIPEKEMNLLERAQTQQQGMIPFIIRVLHPGKFNREVPIKDLYGTQNLNPSKIIKNQDSSIKKQQRQFEMTQSFHKRTLSQSNTQKNFMPPLKLSEIREASKLDNDVDKEQRSKITLLTERKISTPGYLSLRNTELLKQNKIFLDQKRDEDQQNQNSQFKSLFTGSQSNLGSRLPTRQHASRQKSRNNDIKTLHEEGGDSSSNPDKKHSKDDKVLAESTQSFSDQFKTQRSNSTIENGNFFAKRNQQISTAYGSRAQGSLSKRDMSNFQNMRVHFNLNTDINPDMITNCKTDSGGLLTRVSTAGNLLGMSGGLMTARNREKLRIMKQSYNVKL
ncbi:UNKNOWN [Stylonychia lemnae]|uniref:Uncharacterized protein n=1 Tax=Stylonychia lemnae TaxID=5949 RepID=A0A078B408_STYLE|nr:UNKNOWN [Stylonychia lemnae]|eukprot:CDW89275.1 UNKNOWN [Stylonychia lemnae]